jgi:hypothetical protein
MLCSEVKSYDLIQDGYNTIFIIIILLNNKKYLVILVKLKGFKLC